MSRRRRLPSNRRRPPPLPLPPSPPPPLSLPPLLPSATATSTMPTPLTALGSGTVVRLFTTANGSAGVTGTLPFCGGKGATAAAAVGLAEAASKLLRTLQQCTHSGHASSHHSTFFRSSTIASTRALPGMWLSVCSTNPLAATQRSADSLCDALCYCRHLVCVKHNYVLPLDRVSWLFSCGAQQQEVGCEVSVRPHAEAAHAAMPPSTTIWLCGTPGGLCKHLRCRYCRALPLARVSHRCIWRWALHLHCQAVSCAAPQDVGSCLGAAATRR